MAMLFRAALRQGHVPTITRAAPAQVSRPVGPPVEENQFFLARCSYGRGCYGACCMRPDHLPCIPFRDPLDHIAPTLLSDNYWLRSEEHTYELQSLMRISYA